jgi:O-antigen ligase
MLFRIQVVLACEICAAFGTLFRPFWGMLVLIFITFMGPSSDRPNLVPLHIPMVITVAVLVATVSRLEYFRQRIGVAARQLRLYTLFCVLLLLSGIASGWSGFSDYQVQDSFTLLIVTALMMIWLDRPERLRDFVWVFLLCGLYYVNSVVRNPKFMQEQIGGTEFERVAFRHETNFGNPNFLALLMVLMIFFCLPLLLYYRSRWLKLGLLGSLFGYFYVFLHCQSRGATLGLAGGLIVSCFLQRRKLLFATIVISSITLGLTYLAPSSYLDRLNTIINYQQDKSATGRLDMWASSEAVIRDNPLLGVGPGNYEPQHPGTSQHNAYLQVASEVGIPGFLVFISLLLSGFVGIIKVRWLLPYGQGDTLLRSLAGGLCSALVAIMIQGFFTGFGYREFVYITLALIRALRLVAENKELTSEPAEVDANMRSAFALT